MTKPLRLVKPMECETMGHDRCKKILALDIRNDRYKLHFIRHHVYGELHIEYF